VRVDNKHGLNSIVQHLEELFMNVGRVFDCIDPEAMGRETLDFVKVKSETGQDCGVAE